MRAVAQQQNQPHQRTSFSPTRSSTTPSALSHEAHSLLPLQRTMGSNAVQRLLQTHAENGPGGSSTTSSTRLAHSFSRIPVFAKAPVPIQAKLTANPPGDVYEQEADRMAEQMVGSTYATGLSRKCACGGTPGSDGECAACRARRLGLQPRAATESALAEVPPVVHEVLQSPGHPLDPATRAFMEPRFGHDFSRVRVHTDAPAAASAQAVNAQAYTVGRDVVFGAGEYGPDTAAGQRLLAHELTHVLQQRAHAGNGRALLQRQKRKKPKREPELFLDPPTYSGGRIKFDVAFSTLEEANLYRKDYAIIQWMRGCCVGRDGGPGDVPHFGEPRAPWDFPDWVVDSDDKDPVYGSDEKAGIRWNYTVTPTGFRSSDEPRCEDFAAVEFYTALYKLVDIPQPPTDDKPFLLGDPVDGRRWNFSWCKDKESRPKIIPHCELEGCPKPKPKPTPP